MKVYIFDSNTYEYLWEEDAFQEPVGGQFVAPGNGTFQRPAESDTIPPGYVQIFDRDSQQWWLVRDYRGKTAINSVTKDVFVIKSIGELPPHTAIIPDSILEEYLATPDHFNLYDDALVKMPDEEIEALELSKVQTKKRKQRNDMLDDVDWRVERASDATELEIPCDDKISHLIAYRQYLRDFTKIDNWWNEKILTIKEYEQGRE